MTILVEFAGVVDAMERVVGLCETGWRAESGHSYGLSAERAVPGRAARPELYNYPMYYRSPSVLKLL
jgi:hypothetical protein